MRTATTTINNSSRQQQRTNHPKQIRRFSQQQITTKLIGHYINWAARVKLISGCAIPATAIVVDDAAAAVVAVVDRLSDSLGMNERDCWLFRGEWVGCCC